MKLSIEITGTFQSSGNDSYIEFSCFDGEDTMMVSFFAKMSEAHACFLISKGINLHDAYGQMLYKIENEGIESLEVGDKFETDDCE